MGVTTDGSMGADNGKREAAGAQNDSGQDRDGAGAESKDDRGGQRCRPVALPVKCSASGDREGLEQDPKKDRGPGASGLTKRGADGMNQADRELDKVIEGLKDGSLPVALPEKKPAILGYASLSDLEKSYKTAEDAIRHIGFITAERLRELAEAGYAPHYVIDGKGPFFRTQELKQWFKDNMITARDGLPVPTRLLCAFPAQSRPASDAPESIRFLENLQHIDLHVLRTPGVYFLCQDNEVVYVGQSICVTERIKAHLSNKNFDRDLVFYMPVPESELTKVENHFIRLLKPKYNGNPSVDRPVAI